MSKAADSCGCAADAAAEKRPVKEDVTLDALFKALASSQRRELLRIVAANTSTDGGCCATEVCACKLAEALDLAPSTISHHMGVLVSAGLVSAERRGLWVYYRIEREALERISAGLASF